MCYTYICQKCGGKSTEITSEICRGSGVDTYDIYHRFKRRWFFILFTKFFNTKCA